MNVVAVVSPLFVVAAAVLADWSWWVSLIPVLVVVAVVAEVVGLRTGVLAALVATAGVALVVGRDAGAAHPHNGVELGAMAVLLLVAVLFGTDRQPPG